MPGGGDDPLSAEDVRSMSELMGKFLEDEDMRELGQLVRIKGAWTGLVGEKTASKTKPYRLEGGRLFVGVESHAWAQDLHYRKREIKTRIQEVLGLEIEEITTKKLNLK